MGKSEQIQLFQSHQVRSVWDDEQEQWYFAVSDVVKLLTDCKDATDYIKKMRKRDPELSKGWGQIVTPLSLMTKGGRQRINVAKSTRDDIESRLGHTVISAERAIDHTTPEGMLPLNEAGPFTEE